MLLVTRRCCRFLRVQRIRPNLCLHGCQTGLILGEFDTPLSRHGKPSHVADVSDEITETIYKEFCARILRYGVRPTPATEFLLLIKSFED